MLFGFYQLFFAGTFSPVFARSETTKHSNDVHMLPGTSQASKVSLSGVTRQSCSKLAHVYAWRKSVPLCPPDCSHGKAMRQSASASHFFPPVCTSPCKFCVLYKAKRALTPLFISRNAPCVITRCDRAILGLPVVG